MQNHVIKITTILLVGVLMLTSSNAAFGKTTMLDYYYLIPSKYFAKDGKGKSLIPESKSKRRALIKKLLEERLDGVDYPKKGEFGYSPLAVVDEKNYYISLNPTYHYGDGYAGVEIAAFIKPNGERIIAVSSAVCGISCEEERKAFYILSSK